LKQELSVRPVNSRALAKLFTRLPQVIAKQGRREKQNSDAKTEMALLTGGHPLSGGMEIQAYLLLNASEADDKKIRLSDCLARVALILPKSSDEAYFGFFAARGEIDQIGRLLDPLERTARALGRTRIIGPVDGSFWLSYRFKIDAFDRPVYFGEPRNPARYPALFEAAGYRQAVRYRSNFYPPGSLVTNRMELRLRRFRELGYKIHAPRRGEQKELIKKLHRLITELYSGFPTYQPIDLAGFRNIFAELALVADFSLIRAAYKDGEPVGFLIALPDYQDRLDPRRSTVTKLVAILRKRKVKQTVLLYLGAKDSALGLGSALVSDFSHTVKERGLAVVAALIEGDKVTGGYAASEIRQTRHYALFAKDLEKIPSPHSNDRS
jgi:hypothetical protein